MHTCTPENLLNKGGNIYLFNKLTKYKIIVTWKQKMPVL